MNVDAVVARVWPGGVDAVEPLGGGITNRNFKVTADGDAFVLRIGGNDTGLLGIDRNVEHAASLAAASLGIGPEVVAFLEPEGYLVTRFVDGEVGRVSVEEAAGALRRLHAGPPIAGRFDSFHVVETYAEIAGRRGPNWAHEIAGQIEVRRAGAPLVPCHNDLLAANFIHDGSRVWIVDWEYAGMGDPAFDLANYAVNNGLDEDGDRALLAVYGEADEDAHVREAMWGVVQQTLSQLDFDFAAYAEEHFARLERTAAEPRFSTALTPSDGNE